MTGDNSLLDQLGRFMTSAAGAAKGVGDEVAALARSQVERIVQDLQLVQREEFEAVKAIAVQARIEVEALQARLSQLEKTKAAPVKKMIHSTRNKSVRRRSPSKKYRR